jgi:hypothetical protein
VPATSVYLPSFSITSSKQSQQNNFLHRHRPEPFIPISNTTTNINTNITMSQGFPVNFGPIDAPKGAPHDPTAAESWLEPLLLKSNFYRKHFTRDGRRESKSTVRSQSIDAAIDESRKNSLASQAAEDSAAAEPSTRA